MELDLITLSDVLTLREMLITILHVEKSNPLDEQSHYNFKLNCANDLQTTIMKF